MITAEEEITETEFLKKKSELAGEKLRLEELLKDTSKRVEPAKNGLTQRDLDVIYSQNPAWGGLGEDVRICLVNLPCPPPSFQVLQKFNLQIPET